MRTHRILSALVAGGTLCWGVSACSVIDEDLDGCGQDYQLDYNLRLVTNMTTELQTVLDAETDVVVADALRQHLETIFTDHANDVDLSFYGITGDSLRLYHDQHQMNASQRSYTLYLERQQYMHLALANMQENGLVGLMDDERCHASVLRTSEADTIASQQTGLFTARLPMEVLQDRDQSFHVRLYMANCAAALVIDTAGVGQRSMQVFTTGFASAFSICDSVYSYRHAATCVRASHVATGSHSQQACFCTVNFPSPDARALRGGDADDTLWQYVVHVGRPDGTVTSTTLSMRQPLRAGQLTIVKAQLQPDGSVVTHTPGVGVSVQLDWRPGGQYNPVL